MSEPIAVVRFNYFRVRDPAAFAAAVEQQDDVRIVAHSSDARYVRLEAASDSGTLGDALDNGALEDLLSEHLASGQVAVAMLVQADLGERWVGGGAWAFAASRGALSLDLNDIYAMAAEKYGLPSQRSIAIAEDEALPEGDGVPGADEPMHEASEVPRPGAGA
jgi:hypothetical protein